MFLLHHTIKVCHQKPSFMQVYMQCPPACSVFLLSSLSHSILAKRTAWLQPCTWPVKWLTVSVNPLLHVSVKQWNLTLYTDNRFLYLKQIFENVIDLSSYLLLDYITGLHIYQLLPFQFYTNSFTVNLPFDHIGPINWQTLTLRL